MQHYDGSGVDPVTFLNETQDVYFLVLDEGLVRPIMALHDASQSNALRQLAESSHSARQLFSSALKTLAQLAIGNEINAGMKDLAESEITKAKLVPKLAEVNENLAKDEGIEMVQRRHCVPKFVVLYRGVKLTFQARALVALHSWFSVLWWGGFWMPS